MSQRILSSISILKVQPVTESKGLFYLWKTMIANTVIYITTEDERYETEIKFSMKQLPAILPFKIEWNSRCTKYFLFHFWPPGVILFVDKIRNWTLITIAINHTL